MKLFLKIKYDGTAFHGFQTQPGKRCVQSTLTKVLSELFGMRVNVTGCSRTDAGVHALGFVVSVFPADEKYTEKWCCIPVSKIARAANNILDDDIAVVGAAVVTDTSHPRYDVISKEYIYRIYDSFIPDPFRHGKVLFYGREIGEKKIERMNEACSYFVGKHDFTSFMAAGSKITDAVRTVYSARAERIGDEVVFRVRADGFLYNMVRIMTGTLLGVAQGKIEPSHVEKIIEERNRSAAGETVGGQGLYLSEVFYKDEIEWLAD